MRMSLLHLSISLLLTLQPLQSARLQTPVVINGEEVETCLPQERNDSVIQTIRASIRDEILEIISNDENYSNCGPGLWYQVASLNMSDPSQQCPPAWREYNTSGVRGCRRPEIAAGSCPSVMFSTNNQLYSRVCGKVIGYQYGVTYAFSHSATYSLDSLYVHGVSITHGRPRNHIWTYAAGLSEFYPNCIQCNCPCADPNNPSNSVVPSFLGDNYYCESGNPTNTVFVNHLYSSDLLWDGEQCEGTCCSNGKSPPWFSVELTNPTTDDIEARICSPESTHYDNVVVQILEIYIQ